MISRIADHCFWFGRYLERTESTARVLAVTESLALDADLSPSQCWLPVVIVAGEQARFTEQFGPEASDNGETVQRYMTWNDENPSCIRRSVNAARENARSIREVVSLEAWETINELHVWLSSPAAHFSYEHGRYGFYQKVRQSTQLCLGLLRSTMLHDTPLDFIWLGVLLERIGQTARTLDVHHHAMTTAAGGAPLADAPHPEIETAVWLSLLRACSGFEPFMKRRQGRVSGPAVAAFLLLEPRFPRSIRYCVHSAHERLCAIRPPEATHLPGGLSLARLGALDAWVAEQTAETLRPSEIHTILTRVVDETSNTCNELAWELLGQTPPVAGDPDDAPASDDATPGQ